MIPDRRTPSSLVFQALGGTCELYAYGPVEPLPATAEWIRGLHARFTRFDPASELSRFNASAGRWVTVSAELGAVLQLALSSFEESGGLVNAAVLPALVAAGYDRPFTELAEGGPPRGTPGNSCQVGTTSCQIDTEIPGHPIEPLPALLQLRAGEARLAPGAAIDLGGIAKGWIADRAVERMGPNSLASCGGDLYARGAGSTGEGWPVAFADRTLLLADRAAATSGTTKRHWGDGRHHLIDPRTGAPAITDLREVSVLAATAAQGEVLAKTALLLGSLMAPPYLEGRSAGWAIA